MKKLLLTATFILFLLHSSFAQKKSEVECCLWTKETTTVLNAVVNRISKEQQAGTTGNLSLQLGYFKKNNSEGYLKLSSYSYPVKMLEYPTDDPRYVEWYVVIVGLNEAQLAYAKEALQKTCMFRGASKFDKPLPVDLRPVSYNYTAPAKKKKTGPVCQISNASTATAQKIKTAVGTPAGDKIVTFGAYSNPASAGVKFFQSLGHPFSILYKNGLYYPAIEQLSAAQVAKVLQVAKTGDCIFSNAKEKTFPNGQADPHAHSHCDG
ncbi:MAG: hypothetical protein H6765_00215 [Candidatus Peribacteria bacterium]|nr:MAG: hypothetical protein H6765_00215 [Candidatus Peribacteria bacterium]